MLTTWKFQIKDSGSIGRSLRGMGKSVNFCWNFFKETQITALQRRSARVIKLQNGYEKAVTNFLEEYLEISIGIVLCKPMNLSCFMVGVSLDHWVGMFKTQISYKARRFGGHAVEISERDTARACSECLTLHSWIRLGVREWLWSNYRKVNDRDVNPARNILRLGREALTHPDNRKVAGA